MLTRLAQCRAALNQLEEAETLARQAAAVAPADAGVRLTEGMVLLNRGRFAEALSALQAAAELEPQKPRAAGQSGAVIAPPAMSPKPRCTPPARPLR